jgi:ElaB/YqjD/DUF883 family membrane-anchored ribosome-binding protein
MNKKLDTVGDDAETLLDDVRALLEATASSAEDKVIEARKKLSKTLDQGRGLARRKAEEADKYVRAHSYESAAVAFGLGILTALFFSSSRRR